MKIRNPAKQKPAIAALAESNGAVVIDEYLNEAPKDRPWVAVRPLEPGISLTITSIYAKIKAGLQVGLDEWETMADCLARIWVGMGNMADDEGEEIVFSAKVADRAHLLRLNPDLLRAVTQVASTATRALQRNHEHVEADLGNSETSSAGMPEEAPKSSSPGSGPTLTPN